MTPLQKERFEILSKRYFDIWKSHCERDGKDYAKFTVELSYIGVAGVGTWTWNLGLDRYYNDYTAEFTNESLDVVLDMFHEYLEDAA